MRDVIYRNEPCDVDGVTPSIRFSLVRSHGTGRIRTTSHGGINLCDPCWRRIAEPRVRGPYHR